MKTLFLKAYYNRILKAFHMIGLSINKEVTNKRQYLPKTPIISKVY
ncbi:hypothetical protein FH603_4919 [Spirosoma sp. LMG 31447]|uniref:Uncharacterized protein n=1 Tax=Spirosoma utsteinense TaxID=2585773 RepID=A0ABR6WCU7_9BACT|nr:hypothetical protein [Spirosoma utsteinense]